MITFRKAREYLEKTGPITLPFTTGSSDDFTASADTCRRGDQKGQEIIRIQSGRQTIIRVYKQDWRKLKAPGDTLLYSALIPLMEHISKHPLRKVVSESGKVEAWYDEAGKLLQYKHYNTTTEKLTAKERAEVDAQIAKYINEMKRKHNLKKRKKSHSRNSFKVQKSILD